ncbi:MAG: DUF447 family protein [Candidatus Bathyarchaeota archaeon]|nr:DUF447 family protein [Candidatus Bathyarchaeota archaeon]
MADLTSLGFKRGIFSEAIITTYNPDGSANAAPMGLKLLDEQHLSISIFNSSSTCQNLKAKKSAAVNLTSDIEVFYKSTFKEANPKGTVPVEWFVGAEAVEAPKLHNADAVVEVSVDNVASDGDRTSFSCKVQRLFAEKKFPQVYCRAMPLTLEAITHATRVKAFAKEPHKQEEVAKLVKTIQDCATIVERVAPNSQYAYVLADLLHRIDSWGVKL